MVLTSDTNVMEVLFHSDESYTDKGFSAEYSAYDPKNRELHVFSLKHTQQCVRWMKSYNMTETVGVSLEHTDGD